MFERIRLVRAASMTLQQAEVTKGESIHTPCTKMPWTVASAVLLLASVLLAGTTSRVAGEEVGGEVKPVRVEKLPNVPGKTLTAVVVTYAPGGKSGAHQHAGSGLRLCALRCDSLRELRDLGPPRSTRPAMRFFEPPGSKHLISENASATEPASLLAVFVADDGAQLTNFDQ